MLGVLKEKSRLPRDMGISAFGDKSRIDSLRKLHFSLDMKEEQKLGMKYGRGAERVSV